MAALAQCDAFAFIYDQAGDPAPDILVVLKRVIDAGGNPILLGPKTTTTDSAGSFHFTLPELSTAFISARASALWNCPDGRAFTVPPGPSGELVPDFSLPASTLVQPPLIYVDDVLSIPRASETQDGYLSAADYVAFLAAAGAEVGITQITAGTGLTGGTITDTGTIAIATIPGVAGTWSNPSSITVNAQGQIIAISGVADTTAPIIGAVSASSITSSGATITWTTDDPSDSQVEYGLTTSYGTSTTLNPSPVTSHGVPITGTAASTLYHYRVRSRNTAGLLTISGDNTFTTTAVIDTTPPVISAVAATSITGLGATITWTTDDASDSQVEYGPTTSYGTSTTIDAAMVTSHSVPLTGLSVTTLYHYRVKSRNAASLLQTSGDNTFTTTAVVDTTPPVISAVASSSVTDVGATITWTTDEASDSQVEYSTDLSYSSASSITDAVPPGTMSHSVPLSGLIASTLYHYRVKSKDAAANAATPVTGTFTTSAAADLLTGLAALWTLDETATTAVRVNSMVGSPDLSGLDPSGAPGTPNVPSVVGKLGRAVHFILDGNKLTTSASHSSIETGAVDYTIAMWVNIDSKGSTPVTFVGKTPGGDEYVIGYDPTTGIDKFSYTVRESSGSYQTLYAPSPGSPVAGQWYLLICGREQSTNTISLQSGTGSVLGVIDVFTPVLSATISANAVIMGAYGATATNLMLGVLDQVAFWKGRLLDNAARAKLFNGGAGLPFASW